MKTTDDRPDRLTFRAYDLLNEHCEMPGKTALLNFIRSEKSAGRTIKGTASGAFTWLVGRHFVTPDLAEASCVMLFAKQSEAVPSASYCSRAARLRVLPAASNEPEFSDPLLPGGAARPPVQISFSRLLYRKRTAHLPTSRKNVRTPTSEDAPP